jgi:hypothetical protein
MSFVFNRFRRRRLDRAGVTSLELALVLVPFMFLVMAIFDIARYMFTVQSMVTLMMQAERTIMINPGLGSQPLCPINIGNWTNMMGMTTPPMIDPTQGTICINTISPQGVYQIQVTLTYPFTTITPGLGGLAPDGTLTRSATNSF